MSQRTLWGEASPTRYPLAWPDGWARTDERARKASRYDVSEAKATSGVVDSLRMMKVAQHDVVISTNKRLRRDGLPYANDREPGDPGVAVYWVRKGKAVVIPCDCWRTVRENMRAIGLYLEALRMMERTGASAIADRIFEGFARLPPAQDCWQVLGLHRDDSDMDVVHAKHRQLALEHHPDRGGNAETMARINLARDEALAILARA